MRLVPTWWASHACIGSTARHVLVMRSSARLVESQVGVPNAFQT
jgi:hypothetical protein